MNDQEKMLHQIMAIDFYLTDLQLYLDTHPYDKTAIAIYRKCTLDSKKIKDEYQALYGPFTPNFLCEKPYWCWIDNPWPWDKKEGY